MNDNKVKNLVITAFFTAITFLEFSRLGFHFRQQSEHHFSILDIYLS